MGGYFLRGMLIGLLFGLPVGAVGTMTIQRSWDFGVKAGLLTGLGSSVADCLYACIGVFGLTFISDFLLQYQSKIHIVGGFMILIMGIRLLLKKRQRLGEGKEQEISGLHVFASSFVIGLTNPAAILTFIFAFAYFDVTTCENTFQCFSLVGGVFIGTYLWWGLLVFATHAVKKKTANESFHMNQIFGGILVLFAVVILIQTILK